MIGFNNFFLQKKLKKGKKNTFKVSKKKKK